MFTRYAVFFSKTVLSSSHSFVKIFISANLFTWWRLVVLCPIVAEPCGEFSLLFIKYFGNPKFPFERHFPSKTDLSPDKGTMKSTW